MPTAQAEQLSNQQATLSVEELLARAEQERTRLEACGELDRAGDQQPKKAPLLNASLIGRQLRRAAIATDKWLRASSQRVATRGNSRSPFGAQALS